MKKGKKMKGKGVVSLGILMLALLVAAMPSYVSATGKPIKIGCILPLSGAYGSAGVDPNKAVQMLVQDYNAKGGIKGRLLELVIKDSQSSSAMAVSQLQALIEDEEIVAVAGPIATIELSSLKPVAKEEKIPVFAVSSSPGSVDLPAAEYAWRCWTSDRVGMEAGFKAMAEKMGIKRIGVLYQADAFGEGIKKASFEICPKYGIKIVKRESFVHTDTDMTVQLAKLRLAKAQLVVCGGHGATSGYIAKSCGIIGWDIPLWAGSPAANPDTIRMGGAAAEGFWITSNVIPDAPRPGVQTEFANKWKKLTGKSLSFTACLGASGLQVLIAAVEKAAAAGEVTRQTITKVMENMEVETVGGRFLFTPTSHEGGTMESVGHGRVKAGKFVLWEPKPIKNRFDW